MKILGIVCEFTAALISTFMLYSLVNGPQYSWSFSAEIVFSFLLGVTLVLGFGMLLIVLREAGWGR